MPILTPVPTGDKPVLPAPPGSWESWAVATLYVFYQAAETRVRRLEELNRGLAAEVDRQRREGVRRAA